MEIIPNVHQISGFASNCYLIVEADGLTLIDTGLKGDVNKIVASIEKQGRILNDLRRIVITHSDGDHVGGLAELKARSGARVYASAIEAKAIADGRPSRELKLSGWRALLFGLIFALVKTPPATADEFSSDGQILPALGGLRVVATEGHTPGHISLFAPATGILFVGDSIVSTGGQLRGSVGMNTWDQDKADAAVRKQAALGAHIVCSGHGPVVMDTVGKFPT